MALFGWLVLVVVSILAVVSYVVALPFTMGKWNIGGVENPLSQKIVMVVIGCALLLWWVQLIRWTPFTVTIS